MALSKWDAQQLNTEFSTLLAIRRPKMPAARHMEPVPIQEFFWELVRRNFAGAVAGEWRQFVQDRSLRSVNEADPSDTLRVLTAGDMPWASPSP